MIVGRDTQSLSRDGITKATVETVAENTSDGVIAPIIYMAIGGGMLGYVYKAINTMDSMIGYKNDKYLNFGFAAAKLDDIVNFIPSRISGLMMIFAAYITGLDGKNSWHIFKRDRFNHASPNSAQTEAVCAGALRVQLAGDAWYFGELYKKKTIGDSHRKIEDEDIVRANRLMEWTTFLTMLIIIVLSFVF
jgi:adenosylcobinamide-phosphate synthase